ncbi:hypothetical protein Cantr_08273 [Candida viswanathii]|uniref:Uncharacterized protein n=1 Tax=Candida viswanathii TaxID=5486 RepID=A0A367Y4P9_9ASCO|nr:hypothetical protein Cantr_08273 [Candida viswanathii]
MFRRDPFEGRVKSYQPNLSELHRSCYVLLHTINNNPFSTFKLTIDQASSYIINLFYIYAILNLSQFFNHASLLVKIPQGQKYYVPNFIRDTFRHMCRPIPDGNEIWIPKITIEKIVIDQELNKELLTFFCTFNIPVVPIIKEYVQVMPLQAWGYLQPVIRR